MEHQCPRCGLVTNPDAKRNDGHDVENIDVPEVINQSDNELPGMWESVCATEGRVTVSNINAPGNTTPPEDQQRWRPEVIAFADAMEAKLRVNDYKGGWKHSPTAWLIARLIQEVGELAVSIAGDFDEDVLYEAADVANFAMMIVDRNGLLLQEEKQ
jgi:NTP pyrophosphatase (non-canonical NTP hydrolase)